MSFYDALNKLAELDPSGTISNASSKFSSIKSAYDSAASSLSSAKSNVDSVTSELSDWSDKNKFDKISKDVGITYDNSTDTFNIASGNFDGKTAKALKNYIDSADGKYDKANIVIGKDVTFDKDDLLKKDIRFDFKCGSLDIQSQDIADASSMFEDSDIDSIKLADQPNLSDTTDMFKNCKASTVSIGKIPAAVDKKAMKTGCNAAFTTDAASRGTQADSELSDVMPSAETSISNSAEAEL